MREREREIGREREREGEKRANKKDREKDVQALLLSLRNGSRRAELARARHYRAPLNTPRASSAWRFFGSLLFSCGIACMSPNIVRTTRGVERVKPTERDASSTP